MDSVDVDAFIEENRTKIWDDKLKLRNYARSVNSLSPRSEWSSSSGGDELSDSRSGVVPNCSRETGNRLSSPNLNVVQYEKPAAGIHRARINELPPDDREQDKLEFVAKCLKSKPDGIFPGDTAAIEPRMTTMIRIGEYSPLNPSLLSPGKSLLGLGEYEEKRRLLMNRKKQEYREYLAQARLLAKNEDAIRSRRISTSTPAGTETSQRKDDNALYNPVSFAHAGTNTTSKQPDDVLGSRMSFAHAGTNTTPKQTDEILSNRTSFAHAGTNTNPMQLNLNNVAYSGPETNPRSRTRDVQTDRSTLDVGMFTDINAGGDNQCTVAWNRSNNANQSFKYLSPRERKMADLQVSSPTSPSCHDLGEETPTQVRTQRDAYKEELRKQIEEKRRIDEELREKERKEDEAIARRVERQQERMRRDYLREQEQNRQRQEQRNSDVEESRRRQAALKSSERSNAVDSATSSLSHRHRSSDDYVTTDNSTQVAFHRRNDENILPLASDDPRLATDNPRVNNGGRRLFHARPREDDGGSRLVNDGPRVANGGTRFTDGDSRRYDSLRPHSPNAFDPEDDISAEFGRLGVHRGLVLEDSLPIPVFRATSPVIPALRTSAEMGQCLPAGSQAMQKLEAKWQIPAVQKNNMMPSTQFLNDDTPNSRQTVLTQLGAFRRHLQIEQMKMEEKLRKRVQENV